MTVHTTSDASCRPATCRSLVVCAVTIAAAVAGVTACSDNSAPSIDQFVPETRASALLALPAVTPVPCDTNSATPGEVVTRGQGDHTSPVGAVAAYHYAVITERDAAKVSATIAPNQAMGRPDLIQQALGGFAPGTTYCLRLRQVEGSTVLLTLDYQPPAGPAAQYKMRATTATDPSGRVLVTGESDQ